MFKLIFIPKSYHEDVVLISKLNHYAIITDSYHFTIARDNKYCKIDGYSKVSVILKDLFSYWLDNIDQNVFLPFDFSDQYIGGFAVSQIGENFVLQYGIYTDIDMSTGDVWEIIKEDYSQLKFIESSDFRKLEVNKQLLIDSIKELIVVADRFGQIVLE